ncbi:MAG: hypothetical protein LBR80_00165 [Deltaproteobacteria bacterium]|jgi:hypothetical protein|nr:hypothetical protein [Deltaproteobacteria bacterium]
MIPTLYPEYVQALGGPYADSVWAWQVQDFRQVPDGPFSGVRPFAFKGLKAADFDQSSLIKGETVNGTMICQVNASRAAVSGLRMYIAICVVAGLPKDEATLADFASREIPEVAEVCILYFDCIEIK